MTTVNQKAFLDLIAYSEIGPELLAVSDDGYNVEEGSTPEAPILFNDYSDHPHIMLGGRHQSTAAGRYQLLARYWPYYRNLLNLPDFGPDSQDAVALQQIKECHAFDDIEAGNIKSAIARCAHIWASLPGANYGQHENAMGKLLDEYQRAGGSLA